MLENAISNANLVLDFLRNTMDARNMFDVVLLSLLFYFLLALLIKTKSAPIVIGIVVLAILYGFSSFFELPVTLAVLRSFFAMLFIILAIIFQKELRRFFELIGVLKIRMRRQPGEQSLKSIVRAASWLAAHKAGALLVIAGKEPVMRHCEGGVALDGIVSESLLLSIFDPSSPGHDGAVIIDGDKIKKFAAHLPLSENTESTRRYGTRHRAALGLSELTDAMCVVVSEERGVISVAHDKKLQKVQSEQELEKMLADFFLRIAPPRKLHSFLQMLKNSTLVIVPAFFAALVLWGIFTYQNSIVHKSFAIPAFFKNIPESYSTVDHAPDDIIITLSGKVNDFDSFDVKNLKITFDLSDVRANRKTTLVADPDLVRGTENLSLIKMEPSAVCIYLRKSDLPPETNLRCGN